MKHEIEKNEHEKNTIKWSMIFSGLVYVLVGILILIYPHLVYYWVSGGFLIQGLSSLYRAWMS